MSTGRLLGLGAAWIASVVAIAVVFGVLVTELLRVVGVVDAGTDGYSTVLNGVVVIVCVVVIPLPYFLRDRSRSGTSEPERPA